MKDYYQVFIDNMQDVAWMIDKNGRFLLVNQAFLQLYQLNKDEVVGKSYFEILDEKTAEAYHQQDLMVIETQQSKTFETNVSIDKDGWLETEWIETILTPAIDAAGECVGVIGIGRDISDKKQKIRALEEHQEWMNLYFQVPMVGMAVLKKDFSWVDSNDYLTSLLNISPEHLPETKFTDFLAESSQLRFTSLVQTMKALKQEQVNLELELETLMGDTRIAQVHLREAQYGANENLFVLGVEDVTEQRDVTKKLILADKVVQASEEAVLITNAEKEIIRVNPAFTKLTGYTEKEVLGKNPNILQSDRNTRELYDSMWASINQTGSWQGEIWDKRKDGTTYPKWMTISTITKPKSKEVTHYFALFSDVTEKKLAENQIKYLAYHDDLTGMANKTLFETKLVRAVEEAETEFFQLAVLQVDIDNFKTINDSLGHYVGDALIQAVAVEIRSCLRTTDLVARIGGDEFIILLERTPSREHVEKIATKILKRFYQPIDVLNHKMHLSISMGVCVYPEDGENHEALIRNVDTAMNQAKSDGKNQIAFFTKEMSQSAIKRLRMEYELRHAVQHQEFTLVYQPQIDLHDNSICGVEALLRWEHEGNFISPIHFIPVAEECGLIKQIGDWVMHQACATAADWHRRGMNVKMAVNLSGHQFEFTYLTNLIESVLELYDLPASLLCLEITEGVLVGNTSESLRLITALKKIGCTLAIDDFGTGYSSLSYLKAFDVDFLKIDRSFVTGLPTDTDDIAICNAIINLSQSLNLNTVAEGVETAEQVQYMREYGVDKVQGYHFAKPMSAAQVLDFYDAWALNSTTTS